LGLQEARNLGLPDMEFRMEVLGTVWDASVYTGICEFHEAKGFDPCSQEVAISLGWPLFELSCNRDDLSAHRKHVRILSQSF
jgi:hypothetical protein